METHGFPVASYLCGEERWPWLLLTVVAKDERGQDVVRGLPWERSGSPRGSFFLTTGAGSGSWMRSATPTRRLQSLNARGENDIIKDCLSEMSGLHRKMQRLVVETINRSIDGMFSNSPVLQDIFTEETRRCAGKSDLRICCIHEHFCADHLEQ